MGSTLFDDGDRTDTSPCRHSESVAPFLNRAAGAYWEQVRSLLDSWVSRIPESDRPDLVARLRSPLDSQFAGAFWELYLHEALSRSGFDITIHPDVQEVNRQPDFLAESEDHSFYLEAKALLGANADTGADRRRRQLYDSLDKIHSPNFYLAIEANSAGPSDLAARPLRAALESWLRTLDPDMISLVDFGRDTTNTFSWESDGWALKFRAVPRDPSARGRPNQRPLGVLGPGAAWVNPGLKAALSDKGSAYGQLRHPLVIGVNSFDFSDTNSDVMDALYGSLQIRIPINSPSAKAVEMRASDGYWAAGSWAHQHVAGVLVGRSIAPWNVAQNVPTLWLHPHPDQSLPPLRPWGLATVNDDRIHKSEPSEPIHRFLGLPADWPVGEPFERDSV